MCYNEYEKMTELVREIFPIELKKNTLDFLLFLNSNQIVFERILAIGKISFIGQ